MIRKRWRLSFGLFGVLRKPIRGIHHDTCMDDFVKRFNLIDYVVVAEAGLMTGKNLTLLQRGNYKYILGARIRNDFERGQGIGNRQNDTDSHDSVAS